MTLLYLGLALFLIPHLLGIFGDVKPRLKAQLGEMPFKGIYSVVSLAGVVLMTIGYQQAPYQSIGASWAMDSRAVPHALMPFSVILAAGANMKSNLKQFIPHPLALAVLLWSISHLAVRDDLASVTLFGALGVFAILNMTLTSAGPRPPMQPRHKDVILVAAGLVGYGAIAWLHGYLGGVQVFG